MIGVPKITYNTNDLVNLIRNDIVDKFGQRALAGIDLNDPGMFTPEAVYTPKAAEVSVSVTTVEQQLADIMPPKEAPVRASSGTITAGDSSGVSVEYSGGVITLSGGPVKFSKYQPLSMDAPTSGFWIPLAFMPPMNAGPLKEKVVAVPFTLNGVPKFASVSAASIKRNAVLVWVDAFYVSQKLVISWNASLEPESFLVDMSAVQLDGSPELRKPGYPENVITRVTAEEMVKPVTVPATVRITFDPDYKHKHKD